MKLLIISTMRGYPWAGSEEAWHRLALLALERGCSVVAWLHDEVTDEVRVGRLRSSGGVVRRWRTTPIHRLQRLKERIVPSFPVSELDRFDAVLVSVGSIPSLLYTPGLVEGLNGTRAPFVVLCQFNSDYLSISPVERETVAEVMSRAAGSAFVSRQNLEVYRRQFAADPVDPVVLPNEPGFEAQSPLPWPSAVGPARLACVARAEVLWKGQDLLLDVLRRPEWIVRDWRLSFYGRGPDSSHIRKLIRFFGLQGRVDFPGHHEDVKAIWENHHLLVLPSRGEGLPLVVMEAMMCGRPVVATDVGGNSEAIRDGVSGFIAQAATTDSLNDTLNRAWSERGNWPAMGLAGAAAVRECLSGDPAGKLLKILRATAANCV